MAAGLGHSRVEHRMDVVVERVLQQEYDFFPGRGSSCSTALQSILRTSLPLLHEDLRIPFEQGRHESGVVPGEIMRWFREDSNVGKEKSRI